ncbi:MAG: TonB-dependent receptor domain-containing protein [Myxococcota bacterium]
MLPTLLSLLCAQSLSGTVETRGTRDAIPAAVVMDPDGGVLAETDADGRFSLALDAGTYVLDVRASGHRPLQVTETLAPSQRLEVKYRLERVVTGWETVVRGRRDEGPARIELSRVELQEIAGTQGDPFRVTMLLPGVSSIASGLSYPVVRGAQPAATGFFLDGVRLPQLYHLLAGPAVVHPDFIERVDFFPGVLPARFGRLLGGAIDGRVAKPPDRLRVTASVDLLNAGAFVSAPLRLPGSRLDVSLAGRVSYSGPIAAAVAKALIPSTPGYATPTPVVNFGDYQGRLEWHVGRGRLRLFALGVMDEAGTRQDGPGTVTALLSSQFHRVDLAWRQPLAGGELEVGALFGTERLGLLGERDGATFGQFLMTRLSGQLRARWAGRLSDVFELELGLDGERQGTTFEIDRNPSATVGAAASFREPRTDGTLAAAFAQLSWKAGRFSGELGLRGDGYFLDGGPSRFAPEPRLVLRAALREGLGLRAGAALVHQPPTVLLNLPVTDLAGLRDGLQQAVKVDVGADAQLPFDFEATASVFWNQVTRPLEYSLEDLINNRTRLGATVASHGRGYGLELMLRRRPAGRWFGWLSYTFQRSERLRTVYDFGDQGEVIETREAWVPFEFDQAHVVHLTGGVVLPLDLHVSLGLHVNTGRPESGIISSRAMRPGLEPGTLLPAWVPESLTNEPRLPAYARVDARISRLWTFDAFTLEVFLDVLNASATSEILGYTYLAKPGNGTRTLSREAFSLPIILPFLGAKGRY